MGRSSDNIDRLVLVRTSSWLLSPEACAGQPHEALLNRLLRRDDAGRAWLLQDTPSTEYVPGADAEQPRSRVG